jgi:hypothetical protein
MGLSRSTYYDVPSLPTDAAALVATMRAICDEFEMGSSAGSGARSACDPDRSVSACSASLRADT